jgi:hypothetical protein
MRQEADVTLSFSDNPLPGLGGKGDAASDALRQATQPGAIQFKIEIRQ